MCRTHFLAKINVIWKVEKLLQLIPRPENHIIWSKWCQWSQWEKIWLAMEMTLSRPYLTTTLTSSFKVHLPFAVWLTVHLFLTCMRKLLWSRLREADPIASYCAQQCILAHQPCSIIYYHFTFNLRSYTEKLGYLNVIVLDIDVCYSTRSDLPGPLKFILTQWPAVPYSFQTAEWGTAEARAYILKTYPKMWK